MLIDYDALSALSAILRHGSFEAAARELGLTQPAISQRIKALETRIGTVLVQRARPCIATEAGARLMRHAEEVGLMEKELSRDLGGLLPDPARPVRLAVTADSLAAWVLPGLARVTGLLYELTVDDQDHSAEWLKRGEVSAAITSFGGEIAGCNAYALGAQVYAATCSPAFFASYFADGVTAESLSRAPALTFNRKDALQRNWAERAAGTKVSYPTHFLPSTQGFTEAACLGIGWGLNPLSLVEKHLQDGSLVEPVPGLRLGTPLYWQIARQSAPALEPLTRAIRKRAREALDQATRM